MAGFGGELLVGALPSDQFTIGSSAADESDASGAASAVRFIYNSITGAMFFDVDGTGSVEQVQFASLSIGLPLISSDISVIA